MLIRAGFDIAFDTDGPTPVTLLLRVRPERRRDLVTADALSFDRPVGARTHLDGFGNVSTRILAPGGLLGVRADFLVCDPGTPDVLAPGAGQFPVEDLPDETLRFLLGSRYCDTDLLSGLAWSLFGGTRPGWERVQAVCDYVHERIRFDYQRADSTRSAAEAHSGREGVCRDYAHLAVALCRCLNVPARYAMGFLGDIRTPVVREPMDFSAWFEAYLDGPGGGRWYAFDARHNTPRVGRVVLAYGRDAADCALSTSFGSAPLARFRVHTYDSEDDAASLSA